MQALHIFFQMYEPKSYADEFLMLVATVELAHYQHSHFMLQLILYFLNPHTVANVLNKQGCSKPKHKVTHCKEKNHISGLLTKLNEKQ